MERSSRVMTPNEIAKTIVGAALKVQPTHATKDLLASARLRGRRARDKILAAEGGTLGADQVAALLRISLQAVDERRIAGELSALKTGPREYRYPAWQFGETGVLAGLEELLALLAEHPPLAVMRFFLSANQYAGGERPLDLLRKGRLDLAKRAMRTFGEQGAA
jgi:hypothetical protein